MSSPSSPPRRVERRRSWRLGAERRQGLPENGCKKCRTRHVHIYARPAAEPRFKRPATAKREAEHSPLRTSGAWRTSSPGSSQMGSGPYFEYNNIQNRLGFSAFETALGCSGGRNKTYCNKSLTPGGLPKNCLKDLTEYPVDVLNMILLISR